MLVLRMVEGLQVVWEGDAEQGRILSDREILDRQEEFLSSLKEMGIPAVRGVFLTEPIEMPELVKVLAEWTYRCGTNPTQEQLQATCNFLNAEQLQEAMRRGWDKEKLDWILENPIKPPKVRPKLQVVENEE